MNEIFLRLLSDIRTTRRLDTAEILQKQRTRFAEIVAFARANSPYYQQLYEELPPAIEDPRLLPVTNKKTLMAWFNDWVTDREVTLEKARAFVEDPRMIGELFLGKYLTAIGTGSRGLRGIFLIMDDWSGAIYSGLMARQATDWFPSGNLVKILAREGGKATLVATGCNFPAFTGASRQVKINPTLGQKNRIYSVHTPLPQLVAQLNEFRPIVLEGYATTIALLAGEQEAGRLHIDPMLITVDGEGLPASEYRRIERVFNARVGNFYSCTECPGLGYSCEHGWLHINSDWVLLEPVDAHYQPTPPGELSHTVLLTNLYNRIQPIIRYDLGDSILQRPDPCPCGNPLPAVQVQGRSDDLLLFTTRDGEKVAITVLMMGTLVDLVPGVELFQFVQTSPTSMKVRLLFSAEANQDKTWLEVYHQILKVFSKHGRKLEHILIERAREMPEQAPGGKYRTIVPLNNSARLNPGVEYLLAR